MRGLQLCRIASSILHCRRLVQPPLLSHSKKVVDRQCPATPRTPQCIPWRGIATAREASTEEIDDVDTIYALSTAAGRAAIAVIRISGPACTHVYHTLCPNKPLPKPRVASIRTLYAPDEPPSRESTLDHAALLLYNPTPRTVTGEDVLELHTHGGPAIVSSVLRAISQVSSLSHPIRYAEAGEFTRRAFFNDRMDLLQVEALSDVLSATTAQQAKLALRGTESRLSAQYEEWRKMLLYARGELEALIDFSEDQHFDESPNDLAASVAKQVEELKRNVEMHRANAARGELLRNGISIALLGEPNVGKSSLLNRIVGRDAAIVSTEAGTTRDVVEVGIDLGGWFCKLGDVAGLRSHRESAFIGSERSNEANINASELIGMIEKEGMKRAKERALAADIVIVVCSIEPSPDGGAVRLALNEEVQETARTCIEQGSHVLFVLNKADNLPLDPVQNRSTRSSLEATLSSTLSANSSQIHFLSCKDAAQNISTQPSHTDPGGIQSFLNALISTLKSMTDPLRDSTPSSASDPSIWAESLGATERHRRLLEECLSHLDQFLTLVRDAALNRSEPGSTTPDPQAPPDNWAVQGDAEVDLVLGAECLRGAADCLAKITGKGLAGDSEEVLGVVFEKFCVGK